MYNEKDMFCDPEPCPKGSKHGTYFGPTPFNLQKRMCAKRDDMCVTGKQEHKNK